MIYDAIIIGSGAGGLTTASFLAKSGYKVLVLEQHSLPGGYLHGFKRKNYYFDSAVYSIAGCGENGYINYLLKQLGIEKEINFIEYNAIYKILSPFGEWTLPAGLENFKNYTISNFPHEEKNINNLLDEMHILYNLFELEKFDINIDKVKQKEMIQKWAKRSYKEFIDYFIKDQTLQKILYSMWLYSNLPEDKSASLFNSMMFMVHILESSYYIKGGCDRLARVLVNYITDNNGEIKFNSLVEKIIIENDLAGKVILSDGKEYTCKSIIINSSPKHALKNMVTHPELISGTIRRKLDKLETSLSAYAIYFAAKINKNIKSPFKESAQLFYVDDDDNNLIYESCINSNTKPFKNILLTEIPDKENDDIKTFNILSLISYDRNPDWKEIKKEYTENLLNKVKNILKDYIVEIIVLESGTPSTFYRYTLNDKGAMYGFENTKDPFKQTKLDNTTGIANMFLSGHWTIPGPSVYNAMTSGFYAYKLAKEFLESQ